MICIACKKFIENDCVFCPFCGAQQHRQSKPSNVISIGRDPSNDIVIQESSMSRKHAQVTLENNEMVIEDLGSLNGVYVNGYKVHIQRIKQTDRISLGTSMMLPYSRIREAFSRKGFSQNIVLSPQRTVASDQPQRVDSNQYRRHESPDAVRSDEIITYAQWIGNLLILAIPLVNIIALIAWASNSEQPSKANWAKALILIWCIALSLVVIIRGIANY